jgi:hypothetical protein
MVGIRSNGGGLAAVLPFSGARKTQAVNMIGSKAFLIAKLIYGWQQIGVLSPIIKQFNSSHRLAHNGLRSFLYNFCFTVHSSMTRKKGGVGRKHKGGTGHSQRPRIGAGGVGKCHGSGRRLARTAMESELAMPSDNVIVLDEAHDADIVVTGVVTVDSSTMPTLVPSATKNVFFSFRL